MLATWVSLHHNIYKFFVKLAPFIISYLKVWRSAGHLSTIRLFRSSLVSVNNFQISSADAVSSFDSVDNL